MVGLVGLVGRGSVVVNAARRARAGRDPRAGLVSVGRAGLGLRAGCAGACQVMRRWVGGVGWMGQFDPCFNPCFNPCFDQCFRCLERLTSV